MRRELLNLSCIKGMVIYLPRQTGAGKGTSAMRRKQRAYIEEAKELLDYTDGAAM